MGISRSAAFQLSTDSLCLYNSLKTVISMIHTLATVFISRYWGIKKPVSPDDGRMHQINIGCIIFCGHTLKKPYHRLLYHTSQQSTLNSEHMCKITEHSDFIVPSGHESPD